MEFKKYKMEEVATFSQGKQVEIENQYPEKDENMKRFLRIIDFTNPNEPIRYVEDFGDRYYVTKDDLIMIRYGSQTCGKVVIGKEGIIANNMFKINLNNSLILNRYAYYYLKQDIVYNYLRGSQNSSTMPSINFGILNKLEIEVPSIENQRKIIKILDDIDKKIELNNEINNNLYELAINYLKDKVESNKITVSNFAKIQGGYAFKSKDFIDQYTNNRIIKIKNLRSEINADVINSQFVENEVVEKLDNKFRLKKGDVAIAMTGAELGKTGFIYGNDNYYLNQRVGTIRGKSKECELYLNILFLSEEFQILLNSKGYGSAQPNVSTTDIENILISDITEENLNEYYKIIKPIYYKIISNSEELLNLEQLRDTLLPKLMNGEIDLDSIEV
ncbi:MAG: restriction endonuclease subunit S [Tissierellia bacterium]|nr:restriction endonuclease subunit S [Tissierellia bacterium]